MHQINYDNKKKELVNLEPTKSFRMLQVPSINLPDAVKSSVNFEDKEKAESEIKQLQEEIAKLSQEIDELSQSIEKLELEKDSFDVTFDSKGFEASQRIQTEQLGSKINAIENALDKKISILENKIAAVKKAVDNSKRR